MFLCHVNLFKYKTNQIQIIQNYNSNVSLKEKRDLFYLLEQPMPI